ncbi:hypothetical protein VitviT2T_024131 [Vitis vinifera]|uniref:F-box/kelch-repeat protein n=1 Tax=Vitis vinifera TaxID=29760 RepID=A0ABY9DES8_VITVI|nr:hypothetical protein VitviT2T_024131 [Vitis vinifera]
MLVPRAMFACCELDGKIVVAGSFTSCQQSISQVEIYDLEKDAWVSMLDFHCTHKSTRSGVVIDENVHVLHKGFLLKHPTCRFLAVKSTFSAQVDSTRGEPTGKTGRIMR